MAPEHGRQGSLHLLLGAAPCAGKTYALLAEGSRLAALGRDVVVGVAETHGRPDTAVLAEGLEVVPPRKVAYRGTAFEEMDVPAVLTRRPQVVLVDELAHASCLVAGTTSAGRTWRNCWTRASTWCRA